MKTLSLKTPGLACLMKTVGLACLLLVVSGSLRAPDSWAQDRAHQLASQAAQQKVAKCPQPNNLTIEQCHAQFVDGCSAAARPSYDAYLDFLKDQDPDPSLASTKKLAAADFQGLETKLPQLLSTKGASTKSASTKSVKANAPNGKAPKGKTKKSAALSSSNHAAFANQLAGLGEGNIYTVIAYLYFAEDTGASNPPNSETCNCKLLTPNTFDFHIGLGFDANLAARARSQHPQSGSALFTQLQKGSVVAEMTPYPRKARHPNWTFARVNALQGQQAKVVGQLMVDNGHFNTKDDCGLQGAAASCWRSTVWEVHPLMKFYVCNVSSGCDASSPDSAWTDLDNP